jgi:two-component system sensor histidine kinase GlrK
MRLSLFKRLTLGYLAFALMLAALGLFVFVQLNRLNRLIQSVANVDSETIRLSEILAETTLSLTRTEKKHLITRDDAFRKRFAELKRAYLRIRQRLVHLTHSAERLGALGRIETLSLEYFTLVEHQQKPMPDDDPYVERKAVLIEKIRAELQRLIYQARLDRNAKIDLSSTIGAAVVKISSFTVAGGILIGVLIAFFNTRSINRAILKLQAQTREVAAGRFSPLSPSPSPPEIEALFRDFDAMCARLRELDQMKEDFIQHVSHGLRTPLTAIKEASSMLLENQFQGQPDHQRRLLAVVHNDCNRLIASVNRMLDLSRMEAGMMDYRFDRQDIAALVRDALLKLAPIAISKGVALELVPNDSLPPVQGDSDRIYQLLEDLIGNALKYTGPGGRVNVGVEVAGDAHPQVQVCISDTGNGIPADHLKTIFDKFRRIDMSRGAQRGTGLGLSIAKHIVTAHGGKIWAQSLPGEGSAFFFTLPLAAGA